MLRARTEKAKDQRRTALLRAALDEFFENGFAAARLDDIAGRADLSKGTIYLYFESKEALFEALVSSLAGPNIDQLEHITESQPSAVEAIRALCAFAPSMIRNSDLPRLMKVLIGDSNRFPDIVARYRRSVIDRVLAAVAAMLARAKENGEVSIGDPALTARLVVAPIVLSALWQVVFSSKSRDEVDLDALFKLHAETLIKALVIKEASS